MSLLSEYKKYGFVKFPLFDSETVAYLRGKILEKIEPGKSGEYYIDYYAGAFNEDLFFGNKELIKKIKELFKDPIYLPDLNIQINRIDQKGFKRGWHLDCGTEYALKRDYLFDEHYEFLKVGIYLQDDTLDYGGGIEVQPKSHQPFFKYGRNHFSRMLLFLRVTFPTIFPSKRVKVKSGDVILFDSRLQHRSSSSLIDFKIAGANNAKLTIYWTVAGSKYLAESYYSALIGKSIDPTAPDSSRNFYATIFSRRYPSDFNSLGFHEANACGVKWHVLDPLLANYFINVSANKNSLFNEMS